MWAQGFLLESVEFNYIIYFSVLVNEINSIIFSLQSDVSIEEFFFFFLQV